MGHSQAEYHYFKLSDLIMRAHRSKKDKNDAVVIQSLKESAEHLMEEMKKREEDDMKERQNTGAQHTDSGR